MVDHFVNMKSYVIQCIVWVIFQLFFLLERISCIIVAECNTTIGSILEVITGDLTIKQPPNLPLRCRDSSMVLNDGALLLFGGSKIGKKCFQMERGAWKEHSSLNHERYRHAVVTTQTGIFIFGGVYPRETYEYLPKGSTTWLIGKTLIPRGLWYGCAIAVKSEQEIWLIGGYCTERRILSFNVNDHTFRKLPFQLKKPRFRHRCAFIPNSNKVMVTGGEVNHFTYDTYNSTEIVDTEDGSVTMASPMNFRRSNHGMGIITISGQDRLAVFGGYDGKRMLDSVEIYNSETEKWELTDIKLKEPKSDFGFLTIKLGDIV